MKAGHIPWINQRFYQTDPQDKTLEQVASHGDDHKAYGWGRQLDNRWTQDQVDAYLAGYAAGSSPYE